MLGGGDLDQLLFWFHPAWQETGALFLLKFQGNETVTSKNLETFWDKAVPVRVIGRGNLLEHENSSSLCSVSPE